MVTFVNMFAKIFLQPAPIKKYLLGNKLITRGEKSETSTHHLQRNNIARQVEGFSISHLAAVKGTLSRCSELDLGPVPERRNNSIPGINVPYFRDNFVPRINSVPERRNSAIQGINLG